MSFWNKDNNSGIQFGDGADVKGHVIQAGDNATVIVEGQTLQISITNNIVNIIGIPENKEKIPDYETKIDNLTKELNSYLKIIAQLTQRTLTQEEQLIKATKHAQDLLKKLEETRKTQQTQKQDDPQEREKLVNQLAIFDQRYALLDQIEQATIALDVPEVERLLKEKLALGEQLSKNYNLENAEDAFQIATLLEQRLNYTEALIYYEKAVFYNPYNALYLNDAGFLTHTLGQYNTAIDYHNKSLKIRIETLGREHPDVATSYNNIGGVYHDKGQYNKAVEYHKKSLDIMLKTLGAEHPSVATSYNNLGGAYNAKGEYNTALDYYKKSLDIKLKTLRAEHPSVATSYNNIGLAYSAKGEVNKAMEYHKKSLDIKLKTFGEEHPEVAASYNNLGGAYHDKGEVDKAIDYCNKALLITMKFLGENHPNTLTLKKNLAFAQQKLGGG